MKVDWSSARFALQQQRTGNDQIIIYWRNTEVSFQLNKGKEEVKKEVNSSVSQTATFRGFFSPDEAPTVRWDIFKPIAARRCQLLQKKGSDITSLSGTVRWMQELRTMMKMTTMKIREAGKRLRPSQSDFLSLLACRQRTGQEKHSVSASYRPQCSLHPEGTASQQSFVSGSHIGLLPGKIHVGGSVIGSEQILFLLLPG